MKEASSMLRRLRHLLVRWFGSGPHDNATPEAPQQEPKVPEALSKPAEEVVGSSALQADTAPTHPAAYDKNLLERARTQWQFGDWESLNALDQDTLQHHPDRAKLALLAAAGRLQTQRNDEARHFIHLAQEWGISNKLISRILFAGVHNSLGRAAALSNQQQQALQHFKNAINTGTPGTAIKLLTQGRISEQLNQLGFLSSNNCLQGLALHPSPTLIKNTKEEIKHRNSSVERQYQYSSDADIDDFLEDIAPFFFNQSIVYVDIGAYIGEVFKKIIASKKIRLLEAHLFEPNPESYKKLQDAVKVSKMQPCNTYHIGISNTPGTAKFKAARSMTKRIRADISNVNTSNIFEADCRGLDEISEIFTDRRIQLMKLDVEGEELDVLKSAENLLKEQRIDVLYMEVGFNRTGTQQTYFGDLDALLQNYGYRAFKIYEQKHEWIDNSPLLRRCNIAYMSNKFSSLHHFR